MTARLHLDCGEGPGVVLLHGVGAGPATFGPVARGLAADHRVLVVERPGDGAEPDSVVPLGEQAEQVASLLSRVGAIGGMVVGVSGGATLALALAITRPGAAARLVVHEPLVGRHAPDLHDRFAAAAIRAARGADQALAVVQAVMGDATWSALDDPTRAAVVAGAARWQAEIPVFAAFDPSEEELRSLRTIPVLCTVGDRSGADRRAAALVLAEAAGAGVAVIPDAGNAVQLDAPTRFAEQIRAWGRVSAAVAP